MYFLGKHFFHNPKEMELFIFGIPHVSFIGITVFSYICVIDGFASSYELYLVYLLITAGISVSKYSCVKID